MSRRRRYLLDTNILSHLVRYPSGVIADRIRHVGEDAVCTSIVVACELRFGAAKKVSERLSSQVEAVLGALDIEPLDIPADEHYGVVRLALERAGHAIGPNDMLIAAHALALDAVVVTANIDEFARVPGLVVENWLA